MKRYGNYLLIGVLGVLMINGGALMAKYFGIKKHNKIETKNTISVKVENALVTPTVTPNLTPKPINLAELEKKYGPCVKVAVLMYHHIEDSAEASKKNQTHLAVSPDFFKKHMEYLKTKGYQVIGPEELIAAWSGKIKLTSKTAMITLDDAYEDNYKNAFPILKQYGYKATIFTPTGLVSVNDYLNWNEIKEMNESGLVYFGNHTWSHHSSAGPMTEIKREITIADNQLSEKGLNNLKIFAYPYGNPSVDAKKILSDLNYSMAFTTVHGNYECRGQRFALPRIRVGNASLSSFGL